MGKYRFFGNRLTRGPKGEEHPSIDLGFNKGKWENIETTGTPSKNGKYTDFEINPNPNERNKGKKAKKLFFRRYVRKDPKWAKLSEYPHYSLDPIDEQKIDSFLTERKRNIERDKANRAAANKRKNDAKLRNRKGRPAFLRK